MESMGLVQEEILHISFVNEIYKIMRLVLVGEIKKKKKRTVTLP